MQQISQYLSSEALDAEVVSGVSLAFVLLFFVPLLIVAGGFWFYCIFARSDPAGVAKKLSLLWLVACVPASMLVLMGYAFNPSKLHPLIVIPGWVAAGLVPLWLPVGLHRLLGRSR
ncbi:MAG: hypothetical protein ACM3UX_01640 [Candidatus Woesearchaeota archaeon]